MALCAQLEGIENGPATVENSPADPQKNYTENYQFQLWVHIQKNGKQVHKQICVHPVHSSIIHNGQGVRAVSVHQWVNG